MPDFPHPPYVPTATYQPRLLNRWLDINSQNGSLQRIQTYVTIPIFDFDEPKDGFGGASRIVGSFNFEGPNNFSLLTDQVMQALVGFQYPLSIMWIDEFNNVNRYFLVTGIFEEVFYFQRVMYNGQIIAKNFRIEIWDTPVINEFINAAPIQLYTSVRGILDYRYGVDTDLIITDGVNTEFEVFLDGSEFDLPMIFPQGSIPATNTVNF